MAGKIVADKPRRGKRPSYSELEHALLLTQQALWELDRASGHQGDPIALQRARAVARRTLKLYKVQA